MRQQNKTPLARSQGFTLIELMVVTAIIAILAAIALPAYKNYTLKSKFSEVVLAAAPTKTAISTCAVSGDCIASGGISLASTAGGASGSTATFPIMSSSVSGGVTTVSPVAGTPAQFWALIEGAYDGDGASQAFVDSQAASAAPGWSSVWNIVPDPHNPSSVCAQQWMTGSATFSGCLSYSVPLSVFNKYYTATANPLWTAADTAATPSAGVLAMPCIGGANCSPASKYTASVVYTQAGVITATAGTSSGLDGETFVLTPSYAGGRVDWSASGTCKTRAGGALC